MQLGDCGRTPRVPNSLGTARCGLTVTSPVVPRGVNAGDSCTEARRIVELRPIEGCCRAFRVCLRTRSNRLPETRETSWSKPFSRMPMRCHPSKGLSRQQLAVRTVMPAGDSACTSASGSENSAAPAQRVQVVRRPWQAAGPPRTVRASPRWQTPARADSGASRGNPAHGQPCDPIERTRGSGASTALRLGRLVPLMQHADVPCDAKFVAAAAATRTGHARTRIAIATSPEQGILLFVAAPAAKDRRVDASSADAPQEKPCLPLGRQLA